MEQIFIKVMGDHGYMIDQDINNCDEEQRRKYYNTLSKGQVVAILEKVGAFNE